MICTSDKLALCLRLNWHSVNTSLASSQSVCSLTSSQPSTSLHSLTAVVSFPHDTYSITINCCTVLRPGYGNAVRFSPFIAVVSRLSRFPTQQQCNNSTSKPVVTGVKERRIKVQMTVQNVAIFTWHYFFLFTLQVYTSFVILRETNTSNRCRTLSGSPNVTVCVCVCSCVGLGFRLGLGIGFREWVSFRNRRCWSTYSMTFGLHLSACESMTSCVKLGLDVKLKYLQDRK